MTIAIAAALTVAVILFVISVRAKDLPEPTPVSPFQHLDERKAAIYENLRDLQFEYRVGKLSDHDYQQTKVDLQKELAKVMGEIDALKGTMTAAPAAPAPAPAPNTCPSCGSRFEKATKFCGECGKPLAVNA